MNVLDTLLHFTTFSMAFYAAYVVVGSLAFSLFVWRRVYGNAAPSEQRMQRRLRD